MYSVPRTISILLLVSFLPILSQESNKLLRRPWIPTATADEEQSYNKIQSKIKNAESFVVKQDRFGRNYKLKANGSIEYILDDLYFKKFPDKDNTSLAYHEALSLSKNGFWLESLHLLEGILFCERISKNNSSHISSIEKLASQKKNEILKSNSDRSLDIFAITDPYGCYVESSLKIESSQYSYTLNLPLDWSWIYFRDKNDFSEKTESISYQVNYLFKKIQEDPPINKTDEEIFLQKYELANKNELFLKEPRILFMIGVTMDQKPIFNQDNYFTFWDNKRGLTDATKRSLKFQRKKNPIGYESKFIQVNSMGLATEIQVKEFYYWKRGKGIFLALSYPSSNQTQADKDWDAILQSFAVKDADVRIY
ncbi:MAG: hypothetical protein MH321_07660 [Leptospiraceae bacterium]|nr:hypothetical protein [Leptospiraceae bacterium]